MPFPRKLLPLLALCSGLLGSLLPWLCSLPPWPFVALTPLPLELNVTATGLADPAGKGSEVWFYGIEKADGSFVPWDQIRFDSAWEFRREVLVSYQRQPASFFWSGQVVAPITLHFGSHPYSGEVVVTANEGRSWRLALFSPKDSPQRKLKLAPRYAFSSNSFLVGYLAFGLSVALFFCGVVAIAKWLFPGREGKLEEATLLLPCALLILLWSGIGAYSQARYFNGLAFNGAFQFWNPLRRLAAGDLPGRDFFSFHGIGQGFFFLPIYSLLGASLFASEFVRQWMTFVLYTASGYCFLRAFGVSRSLALVSQLLLIYGAPEGFSDLAIPRETSLGLRSTFPLLLASLFCPLLVGRLRAILLLSILGASCLFWSTEQGPVAMVGIFLWLTLANPHSKSILAAACDACFACALAVLQYWLLLTRSTAGNALEYLSYTLKDIQSDQRWFFGAPPNPFLASSEQLFEGPFLLAALSAGAAGLCLFCAWKRQQKSPQLGLMVFAVVSTSLGALLMQTGYLSVLYNMPALRVFLLLVVVACSRLFSPYFCGRGKVLAVAAFFALLLPLQQAMLAHFERERSFAGRERVPELGVSLGSVYDGVREAAEVMRQAGDSLALHSDYRGVLEEMLGSKPTTRYDYLIHALGRKRREEYLQVFNAPPQYVQTLSRCFSRYAQWLQQELWPYYREVLTNYTPVLNTNNSVIWRRSLESATREESEFLDFKLDNGALDLAQVLSTEQRASDEFWEVRIQYKAPQGVFSSFVRHLLYLPGKDSLPVSLPPYQSEFSFPLRITTDGGVLRQESQSLFSASPLQVESVSLKPLNKINSASLRALLTCSEKS